MTKIATALMLVLQTTLPRISQERIENITHDMVDVVDEDFVDGLRNSSMDKVQALGMLAAVAVMESGLQETVETCKVTGDGGRSIGLGQVMNGINWEGHTRKEICSNRKLQLRLALHVIDKCWGRGARPSAVVKCYTSGDSTKETPDPSCPKRSGGCPARRLSRRERSHPTQLLSL